jgi:hypothetical protein
MPRSENRGRVYPAVKRDALSRHDAVECRAAARRHAGFSNEIGTATSAGPTSLSDPASLFVSILLTHRSGLEVAG